MELHARLVVGTVRPVASDPEVASRNALHRSVFIEKHLGSRESWEDFDPEFLRLTCKPATKIAET